MKATALLSRFAVVSTIGLALLGAAVPASAKPAPATPAAPAAPSLPAGLAAVGGPDGIEVSWTAEASAPPSLEVAATATNAEGEAYSCSATIDLGSCLIGVPGGYGYEVSALVADLEAGLRSEPVGLGKMAVPVVDPPVVDPPPIDLPALSGWTIAAESDSAVTVAWEAQDRPELYVSTWAQNADGSFAGWCWASLAAGRCEIPDLENGTTYDIYASLTDGWTMSDPAKVAVGTPVAAEGAQPPSAPSAVIAYQLQNPGPPSAYVSWMPSEANGGAPVKRYEVTATNADGLVVATCRSSRWAEGCELSGLEVGATYVVSVVAVNSAGASEPGLGEVGGLVAAPEPVTVSGLGLAEASDSTVTVTWDAVSGEAGDRWLVAWVQDAAGTSGSSCWASLAEGRCEIPDLENGTAYQVTAVLIDGWNAYDPLELGWSTPVAAEGALPPSAPTDVAVQGYGPGGWGPWGAAATRMGVGPMAWVSWTPSTDNGGAPVKRYEVTATNADGLVVATCRSSRWAEGCELSGLEVGATYVVSVVAVNSAGPSEPGVGEPFVVEAPPGPPKLGKPEVVALGDGSFEVRWSVADETAYAGLAFIVGSDQLVYCATTYEPGTGEASCTIRTEDGSTPTGVYVEADWPCYLFGGPDPRAERDGTGDLPDGPAGPSVGEPEPGSDAYASGSSDPDLRGSNELAGPSPGAAGDTATASAAEALAPSGEDVVQADPSALQAPRALAGQLAVEQVGSRGLLAEGGTAILALLLVLAMAAPLLRRRR